MARSLDTDPINSHNFALIEIPAVGLPAFPIKAGEAILDKHLVSFQSIQLPSMVHQTKKYQEGNWPFQHSILMGQIQTGQVKLRQAVTPLNVDFYQWFLQAASGDRTLGLSVPRRHFIVVQTRADKVTPKRAITLWDCIPVEFKPSSDLDASKSDICIEELTMECTRFDIVPGLGSR